ncbi:hypothetical protein BDZ85DRAFT_108676 [Elsinoe ampelina]|uniref:Uncharacterized protein n=1 Tax=Elsinoe ampelina TaxID=302913 RepID=A0A6A6GCE7_9PEZI|nr:hypothetical protein BDZ85DRAFT_108676 [Elsinoe ampelina]
MHGLEASISTLTELNLQQDGFWLYQRAVQCTPTLTTQLAAIIDEVPSCMMDTPFDYTYFTIEEYIDDATFRLLSVPAPRWYIKYDIKVTFKARSA